MSKLAQQGITYAAANEIELVSGVAEQLAQPISDRRDLSSSATAAACTELSWKVDTLSDCNVALIWRAFAHRAWDPTLRPGF